MFCPSCGNEVNPNAIMCVKCGCSLNNARQQYPVSNQQTGYNNGYNHNYSAYNNGYNSGYNAYNTGYAADDYASGGLKFLCFLIPLIGLILYATESNTRPNKAKQCGKVALIGFIISFVFSLICSVVAVIIPMMF